MNNKDKKCNECSCEIDPSIVATQDFLDDAFDDEFVCRLCHVEIDFDRFESDFQKEFGDALR
jgi:hypothetical protein